MRVVTFIFIILAVVLGSAEVNAREVSGTVVDENNNPMAYATVRIKNRRIGALSDSEGRFVLSSDKLYDSDTISISYVGYTTSEFTVGQLPENSAIELQPIPLKLKEVVVRPTKLKRRSKGKHHSGGLIKFLLDGKSAGDTFGYEMHSKKKKRLVLDKVGFFYCEGDSQMTHMKFRINVYDMSEVKKASYSDKFVNILPEPIYFDCVLQDSTSGKFEYSLPDPVLLPKDAMVEIEFLEDLNERKFWYKCNLVGKRTWSRSLREGYWSKNPFATPFFVECFEIKE